MIGRIQFFTNLTQKISLSFLSWSLFPSCSFPSCSFPSCSLLTSTYTSVVMSMTNINYYLLSTAQINSNKQVINMKIKQKVKKKCRRKFHRKGFSSTFQLLFIIIHSTLVLRLVLKFFSTSERTYHTNNMIHHYMSIACLSQHLTITTTLMGILTIIGMEVYKINK